MTVPTVAPLAESAGIDAWERLRALRRPNGEGTPLLTVYAAGVALDTNEVVTTMRTVPLPFDLPRFEDGGDEGSTGGGERWPSLLWRRFRFRLVSMPGNAGGHRRALQAGESPCLPLMGLAQG